MPGILYRGPLHEDLSPLTAALWRQGLGHRVIEEGKEQVLVLADSADASRARELLGYWQRGELELATAVQSGARVGSAGPSFATALGGSPVTLALIALSVVGFCLVYFGGPLAWVSLLTYEPFTLSGGRPVFGEAPGQFWRLITPIFLHFGFMHIVFNSLWCWELGRRIEAALGSLNIAGLVLATAALSNFAQHTVSGPVLFGGLSGVVYALLGFSWVAGRLNARWRVLVPATPIMLFMVGWLLICMLGVVNVLGFSVANAAHLGGLLSGGALGALLALVYRPRS